MLSSDYGAAVAAIFKLFSAFTRRLARLIWTTGLPSRIKQSQALCAQVHDAKECIPPCKMSKYFDKCEFNYPFKKEALNEAELVYPELVPAPGPEISTLQAVVNALRGSPPAVRSPAAAFFW